MVELGAENVQSEDDIQGNARPLPGRYHAVVKECVEKSAEELKQDHDKVVVEFEVLAGTVPGQEGRVLSEFFTISDKALPRLQRFALCVGLLKPGEKMRSVQVEEAVGQELIIECDENKGRDGKTYINLTYMGMWSLGNKEVADVPKLKGGSQGQRQGQQQSQQQSQSQESAQQTAGGSAGGGNDKWADL